MENINYNDNILIYPITGILSDITNTDITTNYAININILSLINSTGLAVYYNNKQTYKDFNNDIENKQVLNDYTSTDMTVYSYNIYNIYLENTDTIKAYLYNNRREKISDIFQKNIYIDYKVAIDLIDIDLFNKSNYKLDGTISLSGNLYDKIYLKNISGTFNLNNQLESWSNIYEIETSDSTNLIYNLYQDNERIYNINNIISLYTTYNNKQSSPKIKKVYNVLHKNCETPLLNPTNTKSQYYQNYYANPSSTYIGEQGNCCIYDKYININVQPYLINQRTSDYFSLYNDYLTTSPVNFYYDTPLSISAYLSQGTEQNEVTQGELDTTTVITYNDFNTNGQYNNFYLIDYTDSSYFLQFKSFNDLNFDTNSKTNIRIKNKTKDLSKIIYQYNTYDNVIINYDDYTNYEHFGEYFYTGPNYTTTSNCIEQAKYNLTYNNQDSGTSSVINNSSQKWVYGGTVKYYQDDLRLPIMLRVETNHKVNMRLSMKGAATYFPNNYTNLINTVINPNEPFELRNSDTFYINPEVYSNYAELYFDLIDTTTISAETAQDINFTVQISPVKDDRLFLLKSDIDLSTNDEIDYFCMEGSLTENPTYIYNLSSINSFTLNDNYIYANKPFISFSKSDLDLSIEITPITNSDVTSLFNLYFKIYQNDGTSTSDYTIINNLSIGDIVHIYGFNLNSEYIIESYINSDNTNILDSNIESFIFSTPSGICSTPVVIRDNEYGQQNITCLGNCKPAYTYVTSYYPDGNTMHNIYYQNGTASGEPNEQLVTHPYSNRGCNIFYDNSTVDVCIAPYTVRYSSELAGVFFAFSCISEDLTYASSEVIESENYPNQTMLPVGALYSNAPGSSSQKQYEHDYARGTGNYYTYRQYRINNGTWINAGYNSYYYITMAIGYRLEIMQKDNYNNYNHSQSIKMKRQA